MSTSLPILTLRLLDLQLHPTPGQQKRMLGSAKDLLRAHPTHCEAVGADLELFHNPEVIYSSIQLSPYQGASEWTAFGAAAVRTLRLWYELLSTTSPIDLQNTIQVEEKYTPSFLTHAQRYQASTLLVSDSVAKALNGTQDQAFRYARLEKYLYGNLQTFFKFIGFSFDKEEHFLEVKIEEVQAHPQALRVYHHQKKTAFRIVFSCNFRLPQTLRLGQATGIGYGKIAYL